MSAEFANQTGLTASLGALFLFFTSVPFSAAGVADQSTDTAPNSSMGADGATPMTDIHDIKPVLAYDSYWPWWVWLLIVLTIAAVGILTWWLKQRQRHKSEATAAAPALPPEEEAFQQLDELDRGDKGDPKRFYFALSAVLRRYVERRFDFPAAEMTTEELLPHIRRLSMENALAQAFKNFCLSSDPIKFADAAADPDRMNQDITFARRFVAQTTPTAAMEEDNQPSETLATPLPNPNPMTRRTASMRHPKPDPKNHRPNTRG